jgi:hypothetical protein
MPEYLCNTRGGITRQRFDAVGDNCVILCLCAHLMRMVVDEGCLA